MGVALCCQHGGTGNRYPLYVGIAKIYICDGGIRRKVDSVSFSRFRADGFGPSLSRPGGPAEGTSRITDEAYNSTSKITAQGTFKPNCLKIDKEGTSNPVSSDFIQGWDVEAAVKRYRFSHNNSDWSAWTETNPVIGKNKIKETAQVGYNLTFPIYWQYGFGETGTADGQLHAFDAGTSKHEMYLTYNAPITTDDLYETVFHISCTNANEEHSEDSVVSGIWDGFSGRNVKRKDGT